MPGRVTHLVDMSAPISNRRMTQLVEPTLMNQHRFHNHAAASAAGHGHFTVPMAPLTIKHCRKHAGCAWASVRQPSSSAAEYAIAIPSYDRAPLLKQCTLAALRNANVGCQSRVSIFVPSQAEAARYKQTLPAGSYASIVVGTPAQLGIGRQRDFILEYYGTGANVVMLDDDIQSFRQVYEGPVDLHRAIQTGFELSTQQEVYFWGISNTQNRLFLKPTYSIGWMFMQGAFMAFRVRDSVRLHPTYNEVCEDVQYSLMHCEMDGRVLRLNGIGPRTKPYKTQAGGLQTLYTKVQRSELSRVNKQWLLQRYGKYIKDWGESRPHPKLHRSRNHCVQPLYLDP